MDLFAQIDWFTVAIVVLSTIVSVAVIFLLRMKDTYECGFDDGLHSSLTKIAKMRYNKDLDVCICVIPADEYKKEVDQCRL